MPTLEGKCVTGGRLNVRNALSPPVILTVLRSGADEPFQLRVSGGPNRVFVILASTDFSSWTPVEINTTGSKGYFDFVDPDSLTATQQFYRTFAQP